MNLVSRRAFAKIAVGLVAFVPAARVLAAGTDSSAARVGSQAARRPVDKYVGGWVTGVAPGRVKLRSYDGEYVLRLSASSEIWKGAWDKTAVIEVGDRIEAWGTRQAGGFFDVERMWVNIVNLIGPVANIHETAADMKLTHHDRFRGPLPVVINQQTQVVSNGAERLYAPGQLQFSPGRAPQIIGLLLKDGSVRATRVFV